MRTTIVAALALLVSSSATAETWRRHTIDATSRGADGVRVADVNGDGHPDLTTGWEEGGIIRAYINPGPRQAHLRWPAVTVGRRRSPEDACFADLDGDGAFDVISSCEGQTKSMFVHWAPRAPGRYLDPTAWSGAPIECAAGVTRWMFAVAMQVDGRYGLDLVVGSKSPGAMIGYLEAPADPRNLAAWKLHRLYQAGWIMSLILSDMDDDGDLDILASDRRGETPGVLWLENPADAAFGATAWHVHRVGRLTAETMFIDFADVDGDGQAEIIAPARDRVITIFRRHTAAADRWSPHQLGFPDSFGTSKSVRAVDVDLDGRIDLVTTCENAVGARSGVFWLRYSKTAFDAIWEAHDIAGPEGVKFDLIQIIDLDGDGDPDVVTCEERDNLGVIWYENPTRDGSAAAEFNLR